MPKLRSTSTKVSSSSSPSTTTRRSARSRRRQRSTRRRHAVLGDRIRQRPHINNAAMDSRTPRRVAALTAAQARAGSASEVERGLIEALSHRYAIRSRRPDPARSGVRRSMRGLWQKYSQDSTWARSREALMDVHPGSLDPGSLPQDWTPGDHVDHRVRAQARPPSIRSPIISMSTRSRRPPHPERALESADRLRTVVPGRHMVHMRLTSTFGSAAGRCGDPERARGPGGSRVSRALAAQNFYRSTWPTTTISWPGPARCRASEERSGRTRVIAGSRPISSRFRVLRDVT